MYNTVILKSLSERVSSLKHNFDICEYLLSRTFIQDHSFWLAKGLNWSFAIPFFYLILKQYRESFLKYFNFFFIIKTELTRT